jgi:NTP pyrophosphatase (non-canonical NTP hydrolase)
VIGESLQHLHRLGRSDRRRRHEARRAWPQRHERDPHRRARRKTVVDDDDRSTADLDGRAIAPIKEIPTIDDRALLGDDRRDRVRGDAQLIDDLVVQGHHSATRDSTEGELPLHRRPQLAHDEDVERCADRAGDLGRHWHAAARQAENDDAGLASEVAERARQLEAGVLSIRKDGPIMDLTTFQELMRETYGERDRARGLAASVAWLTEEVGELAQAIRKGTAAQQLEELADVLAWLASIADQLELSLDEAAARYASGCPRCATSPCTCD